MTLTQTTVRSALDGELSKMICCPADKTGLVPSGDSLVCAHGHEFPLVEGVPVLLHPEVRPLVPALRRELQDIARQAPLPAAAGLDQSAVDPFVQQAIGATNGFMYLQLIGRLQRYPIPAIPLPPGGGRRLLDIGSNWGRWSIAASRAGYRAVSMDPHPEAVFAARRVAAQLGENTLHVVGDARFLPFRDGVFDDVFSYSVIQHLAKEDARETFREVGRVLKVGGTSKIEMPNAFGLRALYHQVRVGFREPTGFNVRYWRPAELGAALEAAVGPSRLEVDGFLSINPQLEESQMLPFKYRAVVRVSERLKAAAARLPILARAADSLYVISEKHTTI